MVAEIVMLDAGPLGLVTNPKQSEKGLACARWLQSLITANVRVMIPEISDYEVRRELLRASRLPGIDHLDHLVSALEYVPITTVEMRKAAELWAKARQKGEPTAGDNTIDADIILAAQTLTLPFPNAVVATTNVGHLSRFCLADAWANITG
jgi:predicted nucleic acid-binding protein